MTNRLDLQLESYGTCGDVFGESASYLKSNLHDIDGLEEKS